MQHDSLGLLVTFRNEVVCPAMHKLPNDKDASDGYHNLHAFQPTHLVTATHYSLNGFLRKGRHLSADGAFVCRILYF